MNPETTPNVCLIGAGSVAAAAVQAQLARAGVEIRVVGADDDLTAPPDATMILKAAEEFEPPPLPIEPSKPRWKHNATQDKYYMPNRAKGHTNSFAKYNMTTLDYSNPWNRFNKYKEGIKKDARKKSNAELDAIISQFITDKPPASRKEKIALCVEHGGEHWAELFKKDTGYDITDFSTPEKARPIIAELDRKRRAALKAKKDAEAAELKGKP